MDKRSDFLALLRQQRTTSTTKGYKMKPTQIVSVAGGVQKRLETNIKNSRSSRLVVLDKMRNITECESPKALALSGAQQKAIQKKQQLEKWKEKRDKKKQEAAAQKMKAFVLGPSRRRTFGPPPPPPKPIPSTSGRVTRSQYRRKLEPKPTNTQTESFAPRNATFNPCISLKTQILKLAPLNKRKASQSRHDITFKPALPKNVQIGTRPATRTTRAKPVVESKTRKPNDETIVNPKTTKISIQKPPPLKREMFQSSSSSETVLPNKSSSQDSGCVLQDASMDASCEIGFMYSCREDTRRLRYLAKQEAFDETQDELNTPRIKVPKREPNSEEKLGSPEPIGGLTPQQIVEEAKNIWPCVTMFRGKDNVKKEMKRELDEGDIKREMFQSSSSSETVLPNKSSSQDSGCVLQDASMDASCEIGFMYSCREDTRRLRYLAKQEAFDETQDELNTPNFKVPKREPNSEEKLGSPEPIGGLTPQQIVEEAKNIWPCVTMFRGKDNVKKEMKRELDEELLDVDNSNMDSVNRLRRQLQSEIARLSAMCEIWVQIKDQATLPDSVQALVLSAVGQANLLISNKLQQFEGLLESYENPIPGTRVIRVTDLLGFWDLVSMQVENVHMRFKDLEELRIGNWTEEQKPLAKTVVAKPAARKPVVKPSGGPRRLREFIAAARKAKKDQESKPENSGPGTSGSELKASQETKTFYAGFFRVNSPLRQAPALELDTLGLLKSVLSSQAKNVSKQTPSVTPVNLYAIPARSILKPNNSNITKKTEKAKKARFRETDEPSSSTSYTSGKLEPGVAPLPADDRRKLHQGDPDVPGTTRPYADV